MRCLFSLMLVSSLMLSSASFSLAQKREQTPASQAVTESDNEAAIKARKNAWTVGLATGQLGAAYPRLAQDMAKVLDDGDNLRIIPMMTYGSVGNVEDLLYLRNVDIAFTKSDSFEYFKKQLKINLNQRIHYIARLFDAEMHILVPEEVKSLKDLEGKKVNLGLQGNAANVTAPIVFEKLGISIDPIFVDHEIGIEMLKKREIWASIRVAGKPTETYKLIPPNSGFHFLPISTSDFAEHFSELYVLGKLTNQDYPNLIPPEKTINTISVPDILVAYNWPAGTDRFNRVEKFVEAYFSKFDALQKPPFDKKWRDINLQATLPGLTRHVTAERMLKKMALVQTEAVRKDFDTFLKAKAEASKASATDREALFKEFLAWRNQPR